MVAIVLNALLTVVEIVAGIVSGSLALIADAVHNGSDAGSLVVALIARRMARRPPDARRPYGYKRAAIVGALINVVTLVVIGLVLMSEAITRLFDPPALDGPVMMIVAGIAVIIDLATVVLMHRMGPGLNIRAALAHNLSDALASVAVILAGLGVWYADLRWVDPVLTIAIAAFVLLQGARMLRPIIAILMDSVPSHIDLKQVEAVISRHPGVVSIERLRVRSLDEGSVLLDAVIGIDPNGTIAPTELTPALEAVLRATFEINDITIAVHPQSIECASVSE